ncbi:MAG: hypothetical protein JNG84_06905 [Archangium sp.]|nr:hypothetical protein [Archangium sp.]
MNVAAPSFRSDLQHLTVALGLVWSVWGIALVPRRLPDASPSEMAPWQQPHRALPPVEQRRSLEVREAVLELENLRSESGRWPSPEEAAAAGIEAFLQPRQTWRMLQHQLITTYVALPEDATSPRWLVLFIEPAPPVLNAREAPPPVDDEHHTLPDGTALHVTVWSQPNAGPAPEEALSFPANTGWTQWLASGG